jgi:hypothetical protein
LSLSINVCCVKPIYLNGEEGNKDKQDPHAWLSLDNGIKYVKTIQQTFIDNDNLKAPSLVIMARCSFGMSLNLSLLSLFNFSN